MTPLAVAAAIGMMTTAIVTVHWKNGFFVTNGGLGFALLMATAAGTVSLAGPERIRWMAIFLFLKEDWLLASRISLGDASRR